LVEWFQGGEIHTSANLSQNFHPNSFSSECASKENEGAWEACHASFGTSVLASKEKLLRIRMMKVGDIFQSAQMALRLNLAQKRTAQQG